MCWNPYFIVFWQTVFKKTNLDQIITPQKAKLGPDNNSTAYFNRSGRRGALDFQGRRGITSVVRWNLCPVIFDVEKLKSWLGVFGKRCFCPLPKTGGFDEKWRKWRFYILPTKQGALLLRRRKPTKNDENGGRHSGKTTVCQKHHFRRHGWFWFLVMASVKGMFAASKSSTAKLRIWTLRIWGFRTPGFHSARQVLCEDASRLFLDHFPKHLSSVLGRTELCHEVRNPGPQKPQVIRNECKSKFEREELGP